jgi:hypothetical protein
VATWDCKGWLEEPTKVQGRVLIKLLVPELIVKGLIYHSIVKNFNLNTNQLDYLVDNKFTYGKHRSSH